MKSLFEICVPRDDIRSGTARDSDFAADLAQVLIGTAPPEYMNPELFFANTYPTQGLQRLLENIGLRLRDQGGEASSIFRLDTQYGGGKTHSLIALVHLANGMPGVANVEEFVKRELVPDKKVRVAAFDGENADPTNGRLMGEGIRAFTPWGELAYGLAGSQGYESMKQSDIERKAPGAENIRDLFGGEPTLILMDELAVYLRKVRGLKDAAQLTPFLTSLFKAVESAPGAALVFTLALGRTGKASDAYREENEQLSLGIDEAETIEEGESVAARKATLLDPTAENETAQVLRRRLFSHIDESAAAEVISAYKDLWQKHSDKLPVPRNNQDWASDFTNGFPFHPELISTLTDKVSTLSNFQRVRGMLRLLTQTVAALWEETPENTYSIHLHHVDPGREQIRNEIVTRLEFANYDPAIRNDVAGGEAGVSLAEQIDLDFYKGLAPYTAAVATSVLWHTFAFNENLKGLDNDELRYSVLAPELDPDFIDDARKRFQTESAYLDDRPNVPLRFNAEVNLTQIIRRQENQVDISEARAQLRDRIQATFNSSSLQLVPFASGPHDVPDDVGNGRPYIALISYDADTVRPEALGIPELVSRIFRFKGTQDDFRTMQNNLMFLVADERLKQAMQERMTRRLALEAMRQPQRLNQLAEHQQEKIQEYYQRSEHELALSIQQCYRHLFFPTRNDRMEGADIDLGHTAFEIQSASERPGDGEQQVLRALSDNQKLLRSSDPPLAASYVRDNTPLKSGQMSTADLRNEFRKDPRFPIMLGDDNLIKLVRSGIQEGVYVYKSGELLLGPGDPIAEINIDQQSIVYTMDYATGQKLWPREIVKPPELREPRKPPEPPEPPPGGDVIRQEGPLREALTRAWEDAKSKNLSKVSQIELRIMDPTDAFRLMVAINQIPGPQKLVSLEAGYEPGDGGELTLSFKGSPEQSLPVKDFLEPAFRAAAEKELKALFTLTFPDGLELSGDAPTQLTERLARFAAGLAVVEIRG